MYILSLLIATLSCILISCSNDNDKNLTNQSVSYLSSIISENQTEVFDYDKSGKIKEYRILSNSEESKTSYNFENTNEIRILNVIKRGPSLLQVLTYDETMHLESGLAMYVEGEFKEYKDSECLMHKKYRQEFKYNNKNQLINITQTEWNRDNLLVELN